MPSAFKGKNERMYYGNKAAPLADNTYMMEILSVESGSDIHYGRQKGKMRIFSSHSR